MENINLEEWEDPFDSSIEIKPILETSQIKSVFKRIDSTDSFILLYGIDEQFRTYITTIYNQKNPAYIENNKLKNPCLKIILDSVVIDTKSIDIKIGKECFVSSQIYNEPSQIYSVLKDLGCKVLIVDNSDYLFNITSIDVDNVFSIRKTLNQILSIQMN